MASTKKGRLGLLASCLVATVVPQSLFAEEGGSGHYLPGSIASSVDKTYTKEGGFVVRLNAINYSGSIDKEVTVPIAGLAAADVEIDSGIMALTLAWNPGLDLGDNWTYAMNVTIPFVDMTVSGHVAPENLPAGAPVALTEGLRKSDTDQGLGDIVLAPVQLLQTLDDKWALDYRLNIYAPTGDYEVGALANTGKNFWTLEPVVGVVYNDAAKGRDFTAFFGADFNRENSDTNYKSGTQSHIESTYTQHFPLWGGAGGVGATGYYYKQLTGDSGSGVNYGDFKSDAYGAGPVLSYLHKAGEAVVIAELKWLHDFKAEKRPEADTVFLKLLYTF